MIVVVAVVSVALLDASCGDSRPAQKAVRDGRLSGTVTKCPGDFRTCVSVSATVTVLGVVGKRPGGPVAQQHTTNGRFSFLLAPGKYLPSAYVAQASLRGGHCISGEVTVHANGDVHDEVECYIRRS
jgi:hypothetical protein